MPLHTGFSRQTVSKNIAKMINEGYKQPQAIAASLNSARKYWRSRYPDEPYPEHLKTTKKNPAKKRKISSRVGTSQTKKSMITRKKPSSRLKKRRAKNTKKGYYPNPIDYILALKTEDGRIGFLTPLGSWDDDLKKAVRSHSKEMIDKMAKIAQAKFGRYGLIKVISEAKAEEFKLGKTLGEPIF